MVGAWYLLVVFQIAHSLPPLGHTREEPSAVVTESRTEFLEVKTHETGGGEGLRSGPKEFLTLKLDHTASSESPRFLFKHPYQYPAPVASARGEPWLWPPVCLSRQPPVSFPWPARFQACAGAGLSCEALPVGGADTQLLCMLLWGKGWGPIGARRRSALSFSVD